MRRVIRRRLLRPKCGGPCCLRSCWATGLSAPASRDSGIMWLCCVLFPRDREVSRLFLHFLRVRVPLKTRGTRKGRGNVFSARGITLLSVSVWSMGTLQEGESSRANFAAVHLLLSAPTAIQAWAVSCIPFHPSKVSQEVCATFLVLLQVEYFRDCFQFRFKE